MPIIPQVVLWAAGAVATFALARVIHREYQRINEELEATRLSPVAKAERAQHPTLRRDPQTGVYRP